jgi:hypothetical protein
LPSGPAIALSVIITLVGVATFIYLWEIGWLNFAARSSSEMDSTSLQKQPLDTKITATASSNNTAAPAESKKIETKTMAEKYYTMESKTHSILVYNNTLLLSAGSFREIPFVVKDINQTNATGFIVTGKLEVFWPPNSQMSLAITDRTMLQTYTGEKRETIALVTPSETSHAFSVNFKSDLIPAGKPIYIEIKNSADTSTVYSNGPVATVKLVINAEFTEYQKVIHTRYIVKNASE